MTGRVLVGGSFSHAGIWAPAVAGAACVVIAGVLSKGGASTAVLALAGTGGALLLLGAAVFLRQLSRRAWLELREGGFRVIRGGELREHRDDDVQSMTVEQRTHYGEGVPKAITYTVRLWLDRDGVDPPLTLVHKAQVSPLPNPLIELLDRVGASLTERRKAEIERGQTLSGEGWALDRAGLRFGDELTGEHLRFSDVSAFDVFDDQVMVWRVGEEQASFRLPLSARDSYLLLQLLPQLVPERPEADEPGLGRVLFERELKELKQGLLVVGCLAAIVAGVILGVELADGRGASGLAIGAGVAVGVGALLALGGLVLPAARLRCHAAGVVLESALGAERRLRYVDVGSFTYRGTRMYHNGVYTGTTIEMVFLPRAGVVAEPIKYKTTLRQDDPALELLRDHISKVIAGQMAQTLSEGRAVSWTEHLRFLPDAGNGEPGLEHRPAGWIGRKDPVVHPFGQVADFGIDQGWFHLWLQGNEKSVIQEEVAQTNFFPGFYLLVLLFSPAEEAEGEQGISTGNTNGNRE